jgi:hypothetical protein
LKVGALATFNLQHPTSKAKGAQPSRRLLTDQKHDYRRGAKKAQKKSGRGSTAEIAKIAKMVAIWRA